MTRAYSVRVEDGDCLHAAHWPQANEKHVALCMASMEVNCTRLPLETATDSHSQRVAVSEDTHAAKRVDARSDHLSHSQAPTGTCLLTVARSQTAGSGPMRCHLPLRALSFAVLMTSATAFNCSIDLSLISSNETHRGFAQCDDRCDSCNFTLVNGVFDYGTIECVPKVPCNVYVNEGDLDYTTVNGSHASALRVDTNNTLIPWYKAVFYAPSNRGDFRFEATNSQFAVDRTTFHAENTGMVGIFINDDGIDFPVIAEMRSMHVYASTAEELEIVIGANARYAKNEDSSIECPSKGKCVWQSFGQRYDNAVVSMSVVNVTVFPGTELWLICELNSLSCDGIVFFCENSADTCDMQYASQWQCVGPLNLTNGCTATPTSTTATPTSTTETLVTSTVLPETSTLSTVPLTTASPKPTNWTLPLARTTPQHSDSGGNGWKPVLYAAIGGFLVLFCCVVAAIGYFACKVRTKARVIEVPKVVSVSVDDATEMELAKRALVVDKPTTGDLVHGEIEDCEERRQLKDALYKVAKMKRDVADECFGQMVASMRVANDILEDDVFEQIDDITTVGVPVTGGLVTGAPETSGRDDSEERRELKAALFEVAKMKRDLGDEKFGRVLASISVGNEILEEDVFDEMDGVQPTRGEGVAETCGLRLSQVLIAAQPEGDVALSGGHLRDTRRQ